MRRSAIYNAQRATSIVVSIALVAMFLFVGHTGPQPAQAVNTCTFTTVGNTMTLDGDCITDETIFVPDGFTLEGDNHTITAQDPAAGHFTGGVLENAATGSPITIQNVRITTNNLTNTCDAGDDRLRGILIEGVGATILDNHVNNINQGISGCQEGNAVEVRNAPFDGTHPNTIFTHIEGNTIKSYQKGGIVTNGDVQVKIKYNTVTGLGPIDYIAQNGIQVGFGAFGNINFNNVYDNEYTPQTFGSGGILVFAGGNNSNIKYNVVRRSDVGIWFAGGKNVFMQFNKVYDSAFDGIALDNQGGVITGAEVVKNTAVRNPVGIGLYGADNNEVRGNKTKDNTSAAIFMGFGANNNTLKNSVVNYNAGDGVVVESDNNTILDSQMKYNGGTGLIVVGDGNLIDDNTARFNTSSDMQNTGDNTWVDNTCDNSSGAPVDCGNSPLFDPLGDNAVPGADPAMF